MAHVVTSKNFKEEVLDYDGIVLVDFWAAWCAPCVALGPIIEELEEDLKDKAKVVKLNIDENRDIAEEYQIRGIPNIKIFKNGQVVKDLIGLMPKQSYVDAIEEAEK